MTLEHSGILTPQTRELVIERSLAASGETLTLEQLKLIVLMVMWNQQTPTSRLHGRGSLQRAARHAWRASLAAFLREAPVVEPGARLHLSSAAFRRMGKKLIIAEKPSVAADIARALGGFTRKGDYFESDEYVLSSAVGHLLELAVPEKYDVKRAAAIRAERTYRCCTRRPAAPGAPNGRDGHYCRPTCRSSRSCRPWRPATAPAFSPPRRALDGPADCRHSAGWRR